MIQNITNKPYTPSFKANIDSKFLDAADGFYKNSKNSKSYKQFCSAVRRFIEVPNSDSITIKYAKEFKDGQVSHVLYATEQGKDNIVLAKKDMFRKLLDKFSYMNEYEFKIKTGLIKKN